MTVECLSISDPTSYVVNTLYSHAHAHNAHRHATLYPHQTRVEVENKWTDAKSTITSMTKKLDDAHDQINELKVTI